jgi:hypothetical protein
MPEEKRPEGPPITKPGDFATPELEARWNAMIALATENQEAEFAMRPYGAFIPLESATIQRVQFARMILAERYDRPQSFTPGRDMITTLAAMVESFIQVALPFTDDAEDQDCWLQLEERYQQSLKEFLDKSRSEVVQNALAAGSQLSPAMIRQMHEHMNRMTRPQNPQGNGGGLIIPGQG